MPFMKLLTVLINIGIRPTDKPSEVRSLQLTNSLSLVLSGAMLILLFVRVAIFSLPVNFELLVFSLLFSLPLVINYAEYTAIGKIYVCWAPTVLLYYTFITELSNQSVVPIHVYDAIKLYLLGFSAVPFLLLNTRNKALFYVGISLPVAGVLLNNQFLIALDLGAAMKGADPNAVQMNTMRFVMSFFVLSGSCFALRMILDRNEKLSEQRYSDLFKVNPLPMFIVDKDTFRFLEANDSARQHYNYTPDQFSSMSLYDITHDDDKVFLKNLKSGLAAPAKIWRHIKNNGDEIEVELRGHYVEWRGDDAIMVMMNDVTARQSVEKQLKNLVNERDVLIKEIHHRVKNNLQLISSIMYLKSSDLEDDSMKEFIATTRQKIKSISIIHERLLQRGSLNKVDIADYLNTLLADLQSSLLPSDAIQFRTSISSSDVSIDTAIYCGLIINELVTNAVKHAFVGQKRGTIEISLWNEGHQYELMVANDGVALPEKFELSSAKSFGLQLVNVFVHQLHATVHFSRVPRTEFQIHFSAPQEATNRVT